MVIRRVCEPISQGRRLRVRSVCPAGLARQPAILFRTVRWHSQYRTKDVIKMFRTGSGKKVTLEQIPDVLLAFYERNKQYGSMMSIIIGTDSQNFSDTKMVSVIAMICEGHGGIFVYEISHRKLIQNVKVKLHTETSDSLILAEQLVEMLEANPKYLEMYTSCPISIHVDAGNSPKGKTRALIPELVGWIKACGYDVKTKPESFVASTIADRISK